MNDAMTPAGKLQRLEQLVPMCGAIRKGTEYSAALNQAKNEVIGAEILPNRLESLEHALYVLKDTNYLAPADLVVDLEALENSGQSLEQSVDTDALQDAHYWVKDIQKALQRVEVQISRAWTALVQSEFGPIKSLGDVLSQIPDTKSTGEGIQKWANRVLSLANGDVTTENTSRQLNEARTELPVRLKALGNLGVDTNVQSFLIEVANNRATLANVQPSVLDWLHEKNAQSRFRVELI